MKKLIKLHAVLLLISFIFLTACSDNKNPVGTPENPYTIVWYTIGTPPKSMPIVQKKINEYLRQKLGVVLDIRMVDWGQYDQRMNIVEISGEKYDLCFTSSWTNNYERNSMRGAFYPLNELLEKYGQGIKKSLNPAFLTGPSIDGILYAIPSNKEVAQQLVFMFNQDLLESNGFSIKDFKAYRDVQTLESILPYMASVKKNNPGIVPYGIDKTYCYFTHDLTFIMGESSIPGAVLIGKNNYKIINQFEDPTFLEYFKLYRKMYLDGYIPADVASAENTEMLKAASKVAVAPMEYQPCADILSTNKYGYNVVSIPAFRPIITNHSVEGAMIAISVNAPRPDLDMKFLELLNTDPYLRNLINYGIEGVHYKMTGPDSIEFLGEHQNYIVPAFTFGNLFITYMMPGDPKDKWEQFKTWNESAITSQILGFHFDPTPVASELAAIINVTKQYSPGLFTGAMDTDSYLPKFINALKAAGLDRFLAEQQRQLDEWVTMTEAKK